MGLLKHFHRVVSERHYETLIGNKEMNKIVTKVGDT